MEIEIIKAPTAEDWMLCKRCALVTVGKDLVTAPTPEWKHKILAARHSPIRELKFVFELRGVPSWVSVHLCRHVHAQPYVKSQRNDRQHEYDRDKAPQDAPVNMIWSMNAEELMTIANKRLCGQTAEETRKVIARLCDLVTTEYPEYRGLLVPACVRQGGICYEMFPCNRKTEEV